MAILHRWEEDGRHGLLLGRRLDHPQEKAYYFVFAPPATSLPVMVKAIGARWHKDARIKCLTLPQVQQGATLHGRPLRVPVCAPPVLDQALGQAQPAQESEAHLAQATTRLPACVSGETELRKQLACLEAKMSTMQEQLAPLALELLQERSQRYERRLSALQARLPQTLDRPACPPVPQASVVAAQPQAPSLLGRPLHPGELQARCRLIPLIEYGASGQYVVICLKLGELALPPDSPPWYEWFATLSSFRFVGQQGRFSASRKGRLSGRWSASRTIHQHDSQHESSHH